MMSLLITVVVLAIIFDLINGFHDAANSIATVVSTKVLTPLQAVIWAAFFNFVAFWIFDLKVADTVAKTVHSDAINLNVIFAGLIASIFWNLLTWWYGIPSSSSHTLIGGFAGAAVACAGFDVVNQESIIKTFLFIFLAPIIGMIIAYFITVMIMHLAKRSIPSKAERWFRRLQLVSSAAYSIGHGGADSQKVLGIIAAALIVFNSHMVKTDPNFKVEEWNKIEHVYEDEATKAKITIPEGMTYAEYKEVYKQQSNGGKLKEKIHHIPGWIPLMCYAAIGIGTLMGGWRIVKTMGTKITKVTPLEGVAAETAGAITLYGISQGLGVPVSTTHTIAGSIIGVGMTKRLSAVRWGVTTQLLWAWILTIPVSGTIGAIAYFVIDFFSS